MGVNMIVGNDNKQSYLLEEYLGKDVIVSPCEQVQLSLADILKTQVIELLELDDYLSKANKFDTSKTLKLSIELAILLSKRAFSEEGGLTGKQHDLIAKLLENSSNDEAALKQASNKFVYVDNLTLIKASKQVMLKQKCLEVTPNEFSLLLLLIDKMGTSVNKEVLSQKGIGKLFNANHRTVDVHISNLRKKLGLDSKGRERIKTVRGLGYQYVIYPSA